jgi:hypothetical protein
MNVGPHVSASSEIVRGPVHSDAFSILNSSIALGSNSPADYGERVEKRTLAINNFASKHTYRVWWLKLLVH